MNAEVQKIRQDVIIKALTANKHGARRLRLEEHLDKRDFGRYIYVYNNIQTRQVVYSLTQSMNNHAALQQLTYVGKKSVPRALRKDLWRPLCTVLFPTRDQGMSAYKELREYRRLHETQWEPPVLGDHRLPEKRKERKKMLMDQKANSIADIAHVLFRQQKKGDIHAEELKEKRTADEERWNQMWAKHEAAAATAENRLPSIEKALAKIEKERADLPEEETDRRKLLSESILGLRRKVNFLHESLNAVGMGKEAWFKKVAERDYPHILPKRGLKSPRTLMRQMKTMTAVPWSLNGVIVKWAEENDAFYAQEWPAQVQHDILGYLRHSAPRATDRGIRNIEAMKFDVPLELMRRAAAKEAKELRELKREERETRLLGGDDSFPSGGYSDSNGKPLVAEPDSVGSGHSVRELPMPKERQQQRPWWDVTALPSKVGGLFKRRSGPTEIRP